MAEHLLDCKGLACPAPVLQTRKYIQEKQPEMLVVLVDNQAASENVSKQLQRQGYEALVEKSGPAEWKLSGKQLSAAGQTAVKEEEIERCGTEKVVVVIASNVFGSGDDELGAKLMKNFLNTLPEFGEDLWQVILLNGGVKLAVRGSHVLEQLENLKKEGAGILVCGACLEHFKLLDQKLVGETTNMMDVVTCMQLADKVIKI